MHEIGLFPLIYHKQYTFSRSARKSRELRHPIFHEMQNALKENSERNVSDNSIGSNKMD